MKINFMNHINNYFLKNLDNFMSYEFFEEEDFLNSKPPLVPPSATKCPMPIKSNNEV